MKNANEWFKAILLWVYRLFVGREKVLKQRIQLGSCR